VPPAVRLGLEQVVGLGEAAGLRIEAARRDGPFRLPQELARRAGLDRESLLHLARAGALASMGLDRRRAVWEAMRCLDRPGSQPLLESLEEAAEEDAFGAEATDGGTVHDGTAKGGMDRAGEVLADYRTTGLSLEAHPMHFERESLARRGFVTAAASGRLPEGRRVKLAGIVLVRQRPATAGGTIFLTIEDETGSANIVVRPDVWRQAVHQARRAAVLAVHGRIQRRASVVHVVATRLEPAAVPCTDGSIGGFPRMSRDFC